MIDAGGVKFLVNLVSLAHLHVSRAHVPTQTNVIEASKEMMSEMGGLKEWSFRSRTGERLGPFSLKEVCDVFKKVYLFYTVQVRLVPIIGTLFLGGIRTFLL